MPFGGVDNFWLRMTDFGLKNHVFDVKTLSDDISAPFFELGLHLWTHCALALGAVPFGGVVLVFFSLFLVSLVFPLPFLYNEQCYSAK